MVGVFTDHSWPWFEAMVLQAMVRVSRTICTIVDVAPTIQRHHFPSNLFT